MNITHRDAIATPLVAMVIVLAYAKLQNLDWPLLANYRVATALILAIGLATCIAADSGVTPTRNTWTVMATVLGIVALVAALAGIIFNSQVAFVALAVTIGALWLSSSLHHLLGDRTSLQLSHK